MALLNQLSFFQQAEETKESPDALNRKNLGTFQDSLRAPIHRWFTYPAGFSYKAVEETLDLYHIRPGMSVYDPFAGTATTNIVASQYGLRSFGIEAHPFVHFVGQTKLYWDFKFPDLLHEINHLLDQVKKAIDQQDLSTIPVQTLFPELVCKCYSQEKLAALYLCRETIQALPPSRLRNFAKLGLTNVLRSIADVATGWPYIAPQKARKPTNGHGDAHVVERLRDQLYQMYGDIQEVHRTGSSFGQASFILGDSRQLQETISPASLDLAFTSPPYLNNYDYADRTRLEMYFWGEATSWGDITRKVRNHLIMSATTQISRSSFPQEQWLSEELCTTAPGVASELLPSIQELTERRLHKGGKKSYDIMVAGYFNDMFKVFRETFRLLKPGACFVVILGDSAPYGVHIPTDVYLGELGQAIGFARYSVEDLRTRGEKWKGNPQRHKEALKECILTLEK